MAEESGGKQASQTVELLKLYQQVGRSFLGLLLIEIGWTLFLVLAAKLAGNGHDAPAIGKISFVRLWIYGALVLLVFWGVYSRLIYYLIAPLAILLKILSDVFFIVVAILLALLDQLLLPIVRPLRRRLIERQFARDKEAWIAKNAVGEAAAEAAVRYGAWLEAEKERIGARLRIDKGEWLAKYRKEHPQAIEDEAEAAFAAWKPRGEREYAEQILETIAADKVPVKERNLERLIQAMGQNFLTPLHSGLVVGVAPLVRYAEGTDLVFDHAPLQQFGDAIAAARVGLRRLDGIGYIALRPLPALFRIETHARARLARLFFQLDALIWARCNHPGEPRAQAHIVTTGPTRSPDGDIGFRYQRAIFPRYIDYEFFDGVSSFTFAVDDPLDAHIVMCMGVLRALVRRHENGLPKILGGWDESYRSSRVDALRVLAHLAFDVLPLLSEVKPPAQVLPTASMALAAIVSRWAGYQIGASLRWDDEDKAMTQNSELFVPQLHAIVTQCTALTPDDTAHYYRLGALSCLISEHDRALAEFRHAAVLERDNERVRPISAAVEADMSLLGVGVYGTEEDLILARFAAHTACAVYTGAAHMLREQMAKSEYLMLRTAYSGRIHPTIALVQRVLAETETCPRWKLPAIPAAAA